MRRYGLILVGTLFLLFSCYSPKTEIHIHDTHSHSYKVIKNCAERSPPPVLVLIDYHHDLNSVEEQSLGWVGKLLAEGIVSSVYWVPSLSAEKWDYEIAAARLERAFSYMPLYAGGIIKNKIKVMAFPPEQAELPKDFIVSIDLGILVEEKTPPQDSLQNILAWIERQKPRLVTAALSGARQNNSGDMYSYLSLLLQSVSAGTAIYLESETAPPENFAEQYRRWNWYDPRFPDIRPDPWIWYALPVECVELLKTKKVIVKGENRENILAVWNDAAYEKLRKSYNGNRQRALLQSARNSVFRFWNDATAPALPPPGANEGLAVRLLTDGKDRGCVAWYRNTGDVDRFVEYCAVGALTDSRYEPLCPEEAADTILELDIFGNWEDLEGPGDFIPGYHNLRLVNGVYDTILQASLVPQRNYTKEAFLETICVKAGLDKNAWKERKTLRWQRSSCLWYVESLELR